jgi:putative transposase
VTKTAEVSLHGNRYQVDPALVGASVELVFDPFDLTRIEVRYQGRAMGAATPAVISRHVHPAAKPKLPAPPPTPTGIDSLGLVQQRFEHASRQRISYALLADQPQLPGRGDQRGGQAELAGIAIADGAMGIGGHTDGAPAPTATPTTSDQTTITDNQKETQ